MEEVVNVVSVGYVVDCSQRRPVNLVIQLTMMLMMMMVM